jgi:hypothetical protein
VGACCGNPTVDGLLDPMMGTDGLWRVRKEICTGGRQLSRDIQCRKVTHAMRCRGRDRACSGKLAQKPCLGWCWAIGTLEQVGWWFPYDREL